MPPGPADNGFRGSVGGPSQRAPHADLIRPPNLPKLDIEGPTTPRHRQCIPPLGRIGSDELLELAEDNRRFLPHVPRRSGRTSTLEALALYSSGKHYFLSRPRRLGKSLFLAALKELFEGSEALFRGLHIHDLWNWSVRYPVVRPSFDHGLFYKPGYIRTNLTAQLDDLGQTAGG